MKYILIILLCISAAHGQELKLSESGSNEITGSITFLKTMPGITSLGVWTDCGTPVPYEAISDWKTVDTLGDFFSRKVDYSFLAKNLYEWVEDGWKTDYSRITYAVYRNPCFPDPTVSTQYRIHKVTGIRQMRTKTKGTRYEPRPKSEYEQTVESFSQKPIRLPLLN